ncbi:MAG: hypothetical protein E3J78_07685 [Candidatus Cloacimonadota bacterium]|nr:MAG: hypothetical protein E3J78_07685 [Candidatus Cloacimonadota bacterium]
MTVEGYIHQDGTPFIDVLLEIPNFRIRRKVSFLIDTGSPVTILSERDARKLKLNFKKMKIADDAIMGLGGFAETYVLQDVRLHFISNGHMIDLSLHNLFVSKAVTQDEDIINQIPSLLGRDVLRNFMLLFDEKKGTVSLQKTAQ